MSTKNKKTVNARILAYLQSGYDMTASQAMSRFGIRRVSDRISELRKAGFAIYLNTKTLRNGQTIRAYRLGNPTRKQVAAGYLALTDPFFSSVIADELNENLNFAN